MMRHEYRIVKDRYGYYKVQAKNWYSSRWRPYAYPNSHPSLTKAHKFLREHRERKKTKAVVVYEES